MSTIPLSKTRKKKQTNKQKDKIKNCQTKQRYAILKWLQASKECGIMEKELQQINNVRTI